MPPQDGDFAATTSAITRAVVRRHTGAIPVQDPGAPIAPPAPPPPPAPPVEPEPLRAAVADPFDDEVDDLTAPPFTPVTAGTAIAPGAEPASIEDLSPSSASLVGIPLLPERPADRRLRRFGIAFGLVVVAVVVAVLLVSFLPGVAAGG